MDLEHHADEKNVSTTQAMEPMRIALAEDDDELRGALAHLLELEGAQVTCVPNGVELLDFLSAWILSEAPDAPVDLIITDVRMPGINGFNFIESLRDAGLAIPAIIISAFGDDGLRERSEELEGVWFLDKPFLPEQLTDLVRSLAPR